MNLKLTEIKTTGNVRGNLTSIKELANSIKAMGLLQPLTVTKNGKGYELIAGHRRLAALKMLKEKTAFVHVIDMKGEKESLQLAENTQRKDLAPSDILKSLEEIGKEFASYDDFLKQTGFSKRIIDPYKKFIGLTPLAYDDLDEQWDDEYGLNALFKLSKLDRKIQDQAYKQRDKYDSVFNILNRALIMSSPRIESMPWNAKTNKFCGTKVSACTGCEKRTSANLLFGMDDKSEDRCLDKPCFENKTKTFKEHLSRMANKVISYSESTDWKSDAESSMNVSKFFQKTSSLPDTPLYKKAVYDSEEKKIYFYDSLKSSSEKEEKKQPNIASISDAAKTRFGSELSFHGLYKAFYISLSKYNYDKAVVLALVKRWETDTVLSFLTALAERYIHKADGKVNLKEYNNLQNLVSIAGYVYHKTISQVFNQFNDSYPSDLKAFLDKFIQNEESLTGLLSTLRTKKDMINLLYPIKKHREWIMENSSLPTAQLRADMVNYILKNIKQWPKVWNNILSTNVYDSKIWDKESEKSHVFETIVKEIENETQGDKK